MKSIEKFASGYIISAEIDFMIAVIMICAMCSTTNISSHIYYFATLCCEAWGGFLLKTALILTDEHGFRIINFLNRKRV